MRKREVTKCVKSSPGEAEPRSLNGEECGSVRILSVVNEYLKKARRP